MHHRSLGASGLSVSTLSLGSWRTYERISRDDGTAVLNAARAAGIDFLEIARYNDESGSAPIPTGYSEVVFGEIFRASDYARDEVLIASKLWWEFWPGETAAQELDGALERTGLDHIDLLYSDPPPAALSLDELVAQVGALLAAGRARAWGIVNWPAERIAAAGRIALEQGVAPPCMAQLPYNLVRRDIVETPEMHDALELCGAALIPSFALCGGLLTGKYAADEHAAGRMADEFGDERWQTARDAVIELTALAQKLGTTPAALAIAFTLSHPRTASVLVGATRPEQVAENAAATELVERLGEETLARLRAIGG